MNRINRRDIIGHLLSTTSLGVGVTSLGIGVYSGFFHEHSHLSTTSKKAPEEMPTVRRKSLRLSAEFGGFKVGKVELMIRPETKIAPTIVPNVYV